MTSNGQTRWDKEVDVIVVGYGAAGGISAITAYPFAFALMEPATKLAHALGTLLNLHLGYFFALGVADPYLVKFIRPIHSQIVLLHFVLLLCFASKRAERKVRLILVLKGTTFY